MRWRHGEMSGHDLAREPGLEEQTDYRPGEMPISVRSKSTSQRPRDGPGPYNSADSSSAAPSSEKAKTNEIEIQTAETSKNLEKRARTGRSVMSGGGNMTSY